MKTLSHPADQQSIVARLAQLAEEDTHLWGSMSVHQMICHLNDSYRLALGHVSASPASGLMQRTLVKWFALQAPFPWPKGVPTRPELEQGKGGAPPVDFVLDRAALLTTVQQFCAGLPSPRVPHPNFGQLTFAEWMRWGYLHADHHLRQFGR